MARKSTVSAVLLLLLATSTTQAHRTLRSALAARGVGVTFQVGPVNVPNNQGQVSPQFNQLIQDSWGTAGGISGSNMQTNSFDGLFGQQNTFTGNRDQVNKVGQSTHATSFGGGNMQANSFAQDNTLSGQGQGAQDNSADQTNWGRAFVFQSQGNTASQGNTNKKGNQKNKIGQSNTGTVTLGSSIQTNVVDSASNDNHQGDQLNTIGQDNWAVALGFEQHNTVGVAANTGKKGNQKNKIDQLNRGHSLQGDSTQSNTLTMGNQGVSFKGNQGNLGTQNNVAVNDDGNNQQTNLAFQANLSRRLRFHA